MKTSFVSIYFLFCWSFTPFRESSSTERELSSDEDLKQRKSPTRSTRRIKYDDTVRRAASKSAGSASKKTGGRPRKEPSTKSRNRRTGRFDWHHNEFKEPHSFCNKTPKNWKAPHTVVCCTVMVWTLPDNHIFLKSTLFSTDLGGAEFSIPFSESFYGHHNIQSHPQIRFSESTLFDTYLCGVDFSIPFSSSLYGHHNNRSHPKVRFSESALSGIDPYGVDFSNNFRKDFTGTTTAWWIQKLDFRNQLHLPKSRGVDFTISFS